MPEARTPRIVGLVSGLGWHVADLSRAADRLGIDFRPVPFPSVVGRIGFEGPARRVEADGIALDDGSADAVLVRMMPPGTLEQVVFRMDALHRVAAAGVPVVNSPRAVEAAVDKYLALARIEAADLPVPATWAGEAPGEALAAFEVLGGDVVVKPLFGSEGRGLVRASDPELMRRAAGMLGALGAVLYVQRFVRNPGHDARLFVIGESVVGAIRRFVPEGDWRANVAVGGRAEAFDPDEGLRRLALRAARAVGAEVAGVDLILDLDRGEWVVLEVNAVPGWRALAACSGVDVASEILAYVGDRARR